MRLGGLAVAVAISVAAVAACSDSTGSGGGGGGHGNSISVSNNVFNPTPDTAAAADTIVFSGGRVSTGAAVESSNRAVNVNTLPWPASPSTQICPPANFTRWWQIARPSPVPPYFRVVDPSA